MDPSRRNYNPQGGGLKINKVDVDIDIGVIVEAVKEAVRPGLRAVAEDVASRARATTAFVDKDGFLRNSIRVEDPGPESPFLLVKAGGYSASENYAPHVHLVEFGHEMLTKDGRRVGRVEPKEFMRPARDAALQHANEIAAGAMAPVDIKIG